MKLGNSRSRGTLRGMAAPVRASSSHPERSTRRSKSRGGRAERAACGGAALSPFAARFNRASEDQYPCLRAAGAGRSVKSPAETSADAVHVTSARSVNSPPGLAVWQHGHSANTPCTASPSLTLALRQHPQGLDRAETTASLGVEAR